MLDDNDVKKIGETLAPQLEKTLVPKITDAVEARLIPKMMEVFATKEDVREINERLEKLEVTVANLVTVTDSLVKEVRMLHEEYLVLKERDKRYERWFKEIADKVGITLTP